MREGHVPVKSSRIASFKYDAKSRCLEIQFVRGGLYWYFGVPQRTVTGLAKAKSKGRFFDTKIKNRFEYTRAD